MTRYGPESGPVSAGGALLTATGGAANRYPGDPGLGREADTPGRYANIGSRAGTGCGSSRLESFWGVSIMTISLGNLQPIVALLAGVLILLVPRLLNYIVAIYLIVIGIIGLGILR